MIACFKKNFVFWNCQLGTLSTTSLIIKRNMFFKLVILLFAGLLSFNQLWALSFKDQIRVGESLKYKHWNTKKKKITGFTVLKYQTEEKNNKKYLLELNQNLHQDGKIFSEKKVWFDFMSGKFVKYKETDFRSNLTVTDLVAGENIITQIDKKQNSRQFFIKREADLVPFEVITLYLQKNFPLILKKKQLEFRLYLPIIAYELEKNHLPVSLSKLEMSASIEKKFKIDSIFGSTAAVQILVKPRSLLITSLLPKNKTEFRFVFATNPPHYLLMFEENVTQNILIEIEHSSKNQ